MKVRIKRIDNTLPLPKYETAGAVGFDMYTRDDATIEPGQIVMLRSNLVVETPPGYMLLMASRSSLPTKVGLRLANSVAIVDNDFCGDDDEMIIQVYNFTDKTVKLERGQRVAQGIFVRVDIADWDEATSFGKTSRGGFGTTGKHIR